MMRSTLALKPMKSLKHTCIIIRHADLEAQWYGLLLVWVASVESEPHDGGAVANHTIT